MSSEKWRSPKQPPVSEEANPVWLTIKPKGMGGTIWVHTGWYDTKSKEWYGRLLSATGRLVGHSFVRQTCGLAFAEPQPLRRDVVLAWMPFRAPAAFNGSFDE